jgi:hypothetical protein
MIWAYLLHLSYNLWSDRDVFPHIDAPYYGYRPYLRCDENLWDDLVAHMGDAGVNMVVIDIGDALAFESHPEIPIKGAWSIEKMRKKIEEMRKRGIEAIPKLNFSTCHDLWLGKYSRMVSTPEYYEVCRDLINETCGIFDSPKYFHLGMDEEEATHQKHFEYAVMRQHGLWWRDLNFFLDLVRAKNSRPWIWSDYVWNHHDVFFENMPKDVIQSNWYYGMDLKVQENPGKSYVDLDRAGFDQIPTGSTWEDLENMNHTVEFCSKHCDAKRILGYFDAPWRPTLPEVRETHLRAIDQIRRARKMMG